MDQELVGLVEKAAEFRKDPPVERKYIEEALRRIMEGGKNVVRYPTGHPSLRETYLIAVRLEKEAATIN